MHAGSEDFLEEQTRGLTEFVEQLRKSRLEAARKAAVSSAARIRSLNGRIRELARSGVRLTSVSQGTAQSLIELQAEIVNSALTDAAGQIERIAYTGSVRDLAREQSEVLQSARERIAGDLSRLMTILRNAADDARKAVRAQPAAAPARKKGAVRKARKPVARKAKRATRKSAGKPRKAGGRPRKTARGARRA
jgi:phasin family protein